MLDSEIYAKTDAGREEIRSRSLGLTMAARAILLMVDGQRTVSAMRTLIAGSKAPADVLDGLLAQGLIEPRAGPAPASPGGTPPPPDASQAPPRATPPAAPVAKPPTKVAAAAPTAEPPLPRRSSYDGPLDLVLPTILDPQFVEPASLGAGAPVQAAAADAVQVAPAPVPDRYEHLYAMMNEIVRDFLAPHRRFFFQLKIERCGTADELLELLHDLQAALSKARGEAFAAEVISRLRNAAG